MSAHVGHEIRRCKHGTVVSQCRCWDPAKSVRIVACPNWCDATAAPQTSCVFCAIIRGDAPAEDLLRHYGGGGPFGVAPRPLEVACQIATGTTRRWPGVTGPSGLNDNVIVRAVIAGSSRASSTCTEGPCNFITSVGREATQTVRHLHIHVVPRHEGDGLRLPWG